VSTSRTDPPPHEVLDVAPGAPEAVVNGAYRALLTDVHPNQGGSEGEFKRVQRARDALLNGGEER
jgi:DnaJ-class molecular chaperone